MINSGLQNTELLFVINSVAKSKSMDADLLYKMLEDILRDIVAKRYYGLNDSSAIQLEINRNTGAIGASIRYRIIDEDELAIADDSSNEKENSNIDDETDGDKDEMDAVAAAFKLKLSEGRKQFGDEIKIGDILLKDLPYRELTRSDMQIARESLLGKISQHERDRQHQLFEDRVGELVHGLVEKIVKDGILVRITGGIALLKKSYMLPTDRFSVGDKIKATIDHLDGDSDLSQIILSRISYEFVLALLHESVPEVAEGIVRTPAIARKPGYQSKIAVYSIDSGVDPIGACIGVRAQRLQEVVREINNEKIDFILWSTDTREFVENSLLPLTSKQVIIDHGTNTITIVVDEKNLSAIIGRGGQNVKLLSSLFGMSIDVCAATQKVDSNESKAENLTKVEYMMHNLDIDYDLASLLKKYGYIEIEDIANRDSLSLSTDVEEISEEMASELIQRANEYLENRRNAANDSYQISSVVSSLDDNHDAFSSSNDGIKNDEESHESMVDLYAKLQKALIMARCRTVKEIADLSTDELIEIADRYRIELSEKDAAKVINNARRQTYFRAYRAKKKQ